MSSHARRDRLLDAVLDDRLVDERQHLLRLRLCCGQEPRAETGGGENGLANLLRCVWHHSARHRIPERRPAGIGFTHARSRVSFAITSKRCEPGSEPRPRSRRRSRAVRALDAKRRRADSPGRRPEARAERGGRRGRAREAAGAGPVGASSPRTRRAASRSSSSKRSWTRSSSSARDLLMTLPNLPHAIVPVGKSADDNVEVRRHGEPRAFDFEPKPHWDLGPALGILDFERATPHVRRAILGADRRRRAARASADQFHARRCTRASTATSKSSRRSSSTADALRGTGNLPKFEQDLFKIAGDWDLFLIPTAEVPLTNLHRGEILDGRQLPLRYTGVHAVLPQRSRILRRRRARPDPAAPVRQGRAREVHDAGPVVRRARIAHAQRRGSAQASRAAVPDDAAVHGGHGFRSREDLRHRGLAAEPEDLPRDFVLQQHRGVPGAPREHPVPAAGHRQGGVRPHAERFRPRGRAAR